MWVKLFICHSKFSLVESACLKSNLRKGSSVDSFLSRVAFGIINADDFSNAFAVNSRTLFPNIEFHTPKTCMELTVCFSVSFPLLLLLKSRTFPIDKIYPSPKGSPS